MEFELHSPTLSPEGEKNDVKIDSNSEETLFQVWNVLLIKLVMLRAYSTTDLRGSSARLQEP